MSLPERHPYLFTFLLFPTVVHVAGYAARKITELVTGRVAGDASPTQPSAPAHGSPDVVDKSPVDPKAPKGTPCGPGWKPVRPGGDELNGGCESA